MRRWRPSRAPSQSTAESMRGKTPYNANCHPASKRLIHASEKAVPSPALPSVISQGKRYRKDAHLC